MLSLIVRLSVKPDGRDAFLAAVRENVAATLREPGCLTFDVHQDEGEPLAFTFYELYRDAAALEAHRAAPHFSRWREAADALVLTQENHVGTMLPAATERDREPVVFDLADVPTVDRGNGVRTRYLVTRQIGGETFMSGITELEPRSSIRLHSHNCEESVVVLNGRALFECDGQSSELESGDVTWVPAAHSHRFANIGTAQLRILWTYARVDPTRTFTDSGQTISVEPPPP